MAEIKCNMAPTQEADVSAGVTLHALEEPVSQTAPVMTEGDDSVFYTEEEQLTHDSICGPQSAGPVCSFEPNSTAQDSGAEGSAQPSSSGLMGAGCLYQEEIESNTVNHGLFSVTEVEIESKTPPNTKELSSPSVTELKMSHTTEGARFPIQDTKQNLSTDMPSETPKELHDSVTTYTNEISSSTGRDRVGETDLPRTASPSDGLSGMSLEEPELTPSTPSDPGNGIEVRPFNHLKHAKYGTVSYRQIRRGQTRKRIEEFESLMQL